ncbi:MAG: DUF3857 domain-containing protein [Myxococcales bacterium]|nr:DUF3857 domain-containing protein [Myxococcales bacterium]
MALRHAPVLSTTCCRYFWLVTLTILFGGACGPTVTLLKPDNRPIPVQMQQWRSMIEEPGNDSDQVTAAAWNAWLFGNDSDLARRGFLASWQKKGGELSGFGLAEVCSFGPCPRQAAETWLTLLETSSVTLRRVAVHRLVNLLDRVPGLAKQTLPALQARIPKARGSELLDVQAAEILFHQRVFAERKPFSGAPVRWQVEGPYSNASWPPDQWDTGCDSFTREVFTPLGELTLHPLESGAFRAETSIHIRAGGRYLFRVSAGCSVRIQLNQVVLYDKNNLLDYYSVSEDIPTNLTQGDHQLVVWAQTAHGGEKVVVRFVADGQDGETTDDLDSFPTALAAWARAAVALASEDVPTAENALNDVRAIAPDWAPAHLENARKIELGIAVSADVRDDLIDQELQWALSRDATLVAARLEMIRRLVRKGALPAADELVRDGMKLQRSWIEEEDSFAVLGAQVADLNGYRPEAEAVLRGVLETHPDNCGARRSLVEMLMDRPNEAKVWLNLPPGPQACSATVRIPVAIALRAGDAAGAISYVRELRAQEPEDDALFRDEIRALLLAGQHKKARNLLSERQHRYPRSGDYGFWAADIAAELNDTDTSRKEWGALSTGADVDSEHRRRLAALGFDSVFRPFRREGTDVAVQQNALDTITANTMFLLDDWIVVYFSDGSAAYRAHILVRILNESAVYQLGELDVPFGAEVERVRTIKPDGRILEPEDIHEKASLSFVDLEVGDIIEFAYVRFEDFSIPLAPYRAADTFYFQSFDGPVADSRCIVVYADNLKPEFWIRSGGGITPEPIPDLVAPPGFLVRGFRTRHLPQARLEPLAIQGSSNVPQLTVATANWDKIRHAIAGQLRQLQRIPPDLRIKLGQLKTSDKAEVDKIADVFRLIRRAIAEGEGGLLRTSAEYTWAKKSGERAILLWAALRYCGWDAKLLLVHPADRNDDNLRDGANWSRYSYPVVYVRLEKQELWLDLTSGDNGFDYLPPTLQKRPAMDPFSDAPHTELWTPEFPPERELHTIMIGAYLSNKGELTGHVEERQRGATALASRHFLAQSDRESILSAIQTRLSLSFPLVTVDDFEVLGLHEPEQPLIVRYSFVSPAAKQGGGDIRELEFRVFPEELGKNYAPLPERSTPLWINTTAIQDIVLHLTAEPPLQFEETPKSTSFHNPLSTLDLTVERKPATKEGDTLVIRKRLRLRAQIVEPESYELLKSTASRIDRLDRIRIGFGVK